MSKMVKLGKNAAFDKLSWQRQKAVIMLFQGKTLKEISQAVNCHINTVENWKSMPVFQQARREYSIYALDNLLPDAVSELFELITHAKSEMVRLQSIQTVLKHAALLSDNSNPELDKAKIRKANADARVAEARAKTMEDNGQDMEALLDKMLDTIAKEDKKDEPS